jgi:hypothetical protein
VGHRIGHGRFRGCLWVKPTAQGGNGHIVNSRHRRGPELGNVLHLVAVTYHRRMGSGRTKPAVFGCEDHDGNLVGEFILKFKGGLETVLVWTQPCVP